MSIDHVLRRRYTAVGVRARRRWPAVKLRYPEHVEDVDKRARQQGDT